MSQHTINRIKNQAIQIQQNPPKQWKVITNSTKWNTWDVWITMGVHTPYHTVPFKLIVQFPENYPLAPPLLKLENYKLFYHPNISPSNGGICQNTLKITSISMKARQRINAFVELLCNANETSPLNLQAANDYPNYKLFYQRAFCAFRQLPRLK